MGTKVGFGAGYRYHDRLHKEINEFIELSLNNLGLTGQTVYETHESSRRKVLKEKKQPINIIEIYEQVEQLEQDLNNQTIEQTDEFSYYDLFQKMDTIKESERVLLAELEENGASATDGDSLPEFENLFNFHSESEPIKVEDPIQARVKLIVHDLRKNYYEEIYGINYEDIVIGVILMVIYEKRIENRVSGDIIDITGFVKNLWGDKYINNLKDIYKVHDLACEIYSNNY